MYHNHQQIVGPLAPINILRTSLEDVKDHANFFKRP
jgi:hypothetical protein